MWGTRRALRWLSILATACAGAAPLLALPHPDEPIDPSKRAPISTQDAVRPSAGAVDGTGKVAGGVIPTKRASVQVAPRGHERAPVAVSETRPKKVSKHASRKASATRQVDSRAASSLPASIPKLDAKRFQKTLSAYRAGAKPAGDLAHQGVKVGEKRADLAAINRYASPRATLEAQGIPVVTAGSGAEGRSTTAPVPIEGDAATPTK